jgi:hypothetical protein
MTMTRINNNITINTYNKNKEDHNRDEVHTQDNKVSWSVSRDRRVGLFAFELLGDRDSDGCLITLHGEHAVAREFSSMRLYILLFSQWKTNFLRGNALSSHAEAAKIASGENNQLWIIYWDVDFSLKNNDLSCESV